MALSQLDSEKRGELSALHCFCFLSRATTSGAGADGMSEKRNGSDHFLLRRTYTFLPFKQLFSLVLTC